MTTKMHHDNKRLNLMIVCCNLIVMMQSQLSQLTLYHGHGTIRTHSRDKDLVIINLHIHFRKINSNTQTNDFDFSSRKSN